MNFRRMVRRALGVEEKASGAAAVMVAHQVGRPAWTPRDYKHLAEEAYMRSAIAFACVKRIAQAGATVPWQLHGKGGKIIEEHPLLDLMARPAPGVAGAAMMEALYAYFQIAGNAYLEQVGPDRADAPPRELWTLRPDRMRVIPGQTALPRGYEYTANGQRKRWEADEITGESPILHLKDFHPLNDWYGMSRLEAAAYGVDRHNAAAAHNAALLQNGARPSGALVFRPVTVGGEVVNAPQEALDKGREQLEQQHVGAVNAGKPLVLGGDIDWQQMGMTPHDMDFGDGKDDAAWDVCIAMGYPPILMVKGQTTYNNLESGKIELWEETIIPLVMHGASGLNNWLTPRFGDDLRLVPDLDSISALEARRESKRKSTLELVKAGVIDADEARTDLDYGPRQASAVEKVDAAVLTALVNAVPDAGYEPLVRYLRSVGLYDPTKSQEQVLEEIRDLVGISDEPEETGEEATEVEDDDED